MKNIVMSRQVKYGSSLTMVFLLVIAIYGNLQAFGVSTRIWSPASTTYAKHTSYSGQPGNWNNIADSVVSEWNGFGLFSFVYANSSTNLLKAEPFSPNNVLAQTGWSATGAYRTNFSVTVNTCCGRAFYDGTQGATIPSNYYDLRTVLRHEFGHVVGIDHGLGTDKLMSATLPPGTIRAIDSDAQNGLGYLYNPGYTGPQPDAPSSFGIAYYGLHDSQDVKIGYKGAGWTMNSSQPRAYNSTLSWTNDPTSRSWFYFSGGSITWRFTEHWNRGSQTVYIDGVDKGTFNTTESLTRWQMQKTWTLPNTQHVIEIKRSGSGYNTYADTDAFFVDTPALGAGTYDQLSGGPINWVGNWTHNTICCPSAKDGTLSWSNATQDAVTVTFNGTGITYIFTKAPNRGNAAISMDGDIYYLVDQWASTKVWQQTYTINNLSPGVHTIHIAVSGIKNPLATDYYVDIDGYIVIP